MIHSLSKTSNSRGEGAFSVVDLWTKLPHCITSASSIEPFTGQLKTNIFFGFKSNLCYICSPSVLSVFILNAGLMLDL